MNSLPRFEQNPAGIDQVLVVFPRRIYFSFAPRPLFPLPGMPDSESTQMILNGQCFDLAGDHRREYERRLANGGVEACIAFYEAMKPSAGVAFSSPLCPWQMAASAFQPHAPIHPRFEYAELAAPFLAA